MEAADASGIGLLDHKAREIDPAAAALIDPKLLDLFPKVIGPTEAVGTALPKVLTQLGLTSAADVLVAPGGGDNMMSALGAGVVSEGRYGVSLGTSGTIFTVSEAPVVDPTGMIAPFCDSTGRYLPLVCTQNCTTILNEVAGAFGATHAALTEAATEVPPGSRGVTVLPYLAGERAPNWPHATGAVLGLRPGLLAPGVLYRAAMEGATFALRRGLEALKAWVPAKDLVLVGGGANNALWPQMVADVFQLPVRLATEPDSAALGAALQAAAVATGADIAEYVASHLPDSGQVIEPDPRVAKAYERSYSQF